MKGFLICEDGPLGEWVFTFDEGNHWTIGRDKDVCTFVLQDPMVSRKHLSIFFENDTYFIQNESSTNPALLNESPIEEKTPLTEDDLIQIGNNTFRFSLSLPEKQQQEELAFSKQEPSTPLTLGHFTKSHTPSKWVLKVMNGSATGATFPLVEGESYVIGSDSEHSDILLHDLSVSKAHARITLSSSGEVALIDLQSRNGVFVQGKKIASDRVLHPFDQIHLGNTSILFLDMDQTRETIYSPGISTPFPSEDSIFSEEKKEEKPPHWKDTFIPTKHLALASVFSAFICIGIISMLALFRSSSVEPPSVDESMQIQSAVSHFQAVEFNYNKTTSTLFLTGHVLNEISYSELSYRLKNIPYIGTIDDNVIIDSIVCSNINALLSKNPQWQSVLMTARDPGEFLLTGYIQTEEERASLTDFINNYFDYLNLLQNQVVAQDSLNAHIESMLLDKGFANVVIQQTNGQLILSGRADEADKETFTQLVEEILHVQGIRVVQNFVLFTTKSSSAIDITSKYQVTGSSKFGNANQFVLINGKILGVNDTLDGMIISSISNNQILLQQGGIKYKIDFNE